jgi:hypothetical protein
MLALTVVIVVALIIGLEIIEFGCFLNSSFLFSTRYHPTLLSKYIEIENFVVVLCFSRKV